MSCVVIWGSVAEWVTAGVACLAAVAAFLALRHSRKSNDYSEETARASVEANELTATAFAADARVRDEAQARLVYSTVVETSVYFDGQVISPPAGDNLTIFDGNPVRSRPGETDLIANGDVSVVLVLVHNESSELIGPFQSSVHIPGDTGSRSTGGFGPLLPGTSALVRVVVSGTHASLIPVVAFRDSTGKWWSRKGYEPVAPLDDKRRELYESMER